MKRLRGGSGLGDSVYLRPIVDHLIAQGERIAVMSFYPDVFIGSGATVLPFGKERIDVLAHYAGGRMDQASTQYADMLRSARLPIDLPLRFKWTVRNQGLIADLLREAAGDPIVLVHGGRAPFGRSDGYGKEMLPVREAFEAVLGVLADCFTVRIGKGEQFYSLPAELDWNNRTSVSDLLDMVSICDAVVTQCGFPVPMAECFDKPLLGIWSTRGLASPDAIIASITPAKILSKPSSCFVRDDWGAQRIQAGTRAFRDAWRSVAVSA